MWGTFRPPDTHNKQNKFTWRVAVFDAKWNKTAREKQQNVFILCRSIVG
jgi:hypothetical protein